RRAGHPDRDRSGLAGHGGRELQRAVRAGRRAEERHQDAGRRDARHDGRSEDSGVDGQVGLRACDRFRPRAGAEGGRRRIRALGADHQEAGIQGAVMGEFSMNRRDALKLGLAASATALAAPRSFSQAAFPSRPIKLVVPFSAGGVNDIIGRQWAERMKPVLGSVYVENVGGAGGTLGVLEVKRAEPDGHTLALGSTSTMVLNTMTMSNAGYDPNRDFVPIAIFCVSTTSIAVHPSVPATNVKELIAYVKANAGKVSYGSAGTGTMSHLSGEMFKLRTGMSDVVHIPYKGAGPGLADLVSVHIPIMSPTISRQILGLHQAGHSNS